MNLIKKNIKVIITFILGGIVFGTLGVVAYSVYANTVTYDNTQSGLQSTEVQGAIDELYTKARSCAKIEGCDNCEIYRWSTSEWTTNQDISQFAVGRDYVLQKSQLATMDSRASKYYLKEKIEDNVVKGKYVCFVITSAMASANPGMTAGTYCLKGGDSGASDATNKNTLTTAFGSSRCSGSMPFSCSVSGLMAYTGPAGDVSVLDNTARCDIGSWEGSSLCRER